MRAQDCIFFQLAKASQKATRFWGHRIGHLHITAIQGLVVKFLAEEDGITSNQLGERSNLDSATLTGILDRLEASQILERRPKPGDRRALLICLTEKGRNIGEELNGLSDDANAEFLSALDANEIQVFRRLLARVREG